MLHLHRNITISAFFLLILRNVICRLYSHLTSFFFLVVSNSVLQQSNSISNLEGIVPHLALSLLFAWVIVFLALAKGVQSLGKVSVDSQKVPYLIIVGF
jgi:hypothetical protein